MDKLEVGKLYKGIYPNSHNKQVAECFLPNGTYFIIFEDDVVLVIEAIKRVGQINSYKLLIGETIVELFIDEFSYDIEWTEIKE